MLFVFVLCGKIALYVVDRPRPAKPPIFACVLFVGEQDPETIKTVIRFLLGEEVEVGEGAIATALEAFENHSQASSCHAAKR